MCKRRYHYFELQRAHLKINGHTIDIIPYGTVRYNIYGRLYRSAPVLQESGVMRLHVYERTGNYRESIHKHCRGKYVNTHLNDSSWFAAALFLVRFRFRAFAGKSGMGSYCHSRPKNSSTTPSLRSLRMRIRPFSRGQGN